MIAERTGIDVISDFRVRDVAAGGQGAPLVTLADTILFRAPRGVRALQNLGGIGNVTVVADVVRAFDTGPGVVVIDGVVRRLTGLPYDTDGRLAREGRPLESAGQACVDRCMGSPRRRPSRPVASCSPPSM